MTKDDVVAADVNYVETEQNPRLSWQNCDITKEKDVEKLREYLKEKNDIKVIYIITITINNFQTDIIWANGKIM